MFELIFIVAIWVGCIAFTLYSMHKMKVLRQGYVKQLTLPFKKFVRKDNDV